METTPKPPKHQTTNQGMNSGSFFLVWLVWLCLFGSEVTKNPMNGGLPCPAVLIETQGGSRPWVMTPRRMAVGHELPGLIGVMGHLQGVYGVLWVLSTAPPPIHCGTCLFFSHFSTKKNHTKDGEEPFLCHQNG